MRVAILVLLIFGLSGAGSAADKIDYQRDIQPLLAHKCGACHGALKQESGLRLDAGMLVRRGGDGGEVIVPGKAAESPLIERITSEDRHEKMPPEGLGEALNAKQIRLLSEWINHGAVVPENEDIPADPAQHWAYQIPVRPSLPWVGDVRWSHPIDAFVATEHQRKGLIAVEPADRNTVLRRLYLTLIGLPPTRNQIQQYAGDVSPDAWNRLVDTLLASPHYGERWGRHWMDVWRYSDWDGYKQQLRGSQRHIWRWRDWIVRSLNNDKGYDQMIVEMLAADELAPGDSDLLPATGFLARNYHKSNRNIWLDATVEHTAKAFLGVTLNCARCHDHKYDPIGQAEYYGFRAIFEPHNVRTDRLPGQPNLMMDGLPRAFDADLTAETFVYLQGNEKYPDKENPVTPSVPSVLKGSLEVRPIDVPLLERYPALKEFAVHEDLSKARRQLARVEKERTAPQQLADSGSETSDPESRRDGTSELKLDVARLRVKSLETRYAADLAKNAAGQSSVGEDRQQELAREAACAERQLSLRQAELTLLEKQIVLQEAKSKDEETSDEDEQVKKKSQDAVSAASKAVTEAEKKLKEAREAVAKTDGNYTSLGDEYPSTSSGRRLALAKWIASTANPLTARVAVNHIWMRHFGEPLVDNVFDFGLRSPRPRHADLLDWLAVELMDNDWSMKHMHRLIVTSRTWRLASSTEDSFDSANVSIDRDNHFLWRANARRLDAEIIRDCVLAVTGQLDRTLGGPDIDFHEGEKTRRRSIYLRHAYEKQMTMLVLFDAASPTECYRRSESIIPQQALALANSSMALGQSRLLARNLWSEFERGDKEQERRFIQQAYRQILSRPPLEKELIACLKFLSDQAHILSDKSKLTTFVGGTQPTIQPADDPKGRARENLVHVLINHNDFVTVR